MADSVCFRFVWKGDSQSAWLYYRWGGEAMRQSALAFLKLLPPQGTETDITRREPDAITCEFMRTCETPSRCRTSPMWACDAGTWEIDTERGDAHRLESETYLENDSEQAWRTVELQAKVLENHHALLTQHHDYICKNIQASGATTCPVCNPMKPTEPPKDANGVPLECDCVGLGCDHVGTAQHYAYRPPRGGQKK